MAGVCQVISSSGDPNKLYQIRLRQSVVMSQLSQPPPTNQGEQIGIVQVLIDAIPNPIFYTDRGGRYLGCNQAFESFFGFSGEVLRGKTPLEVFTDPELARVYHQKNLELLRNPKVQIYSTKARHKDGSIRDIISHKSAYLDVNGGVLGIVGVTVDVSEQKRLEQELRDSETRFRAIADYTYNWENWVDEFGKLRWVNPSVERVTGYTPQECYAMSDFPLPITHPDDRDQVVKGFAAAVAGEECHSIQHRMVRKDGRTVWVEVSHQPAYDASGKFIGHRSSVRDISDLKAATAKLFEMQQMLQLVLDHIPQRVFWKDRESRYLGANRAFLADLGLGSRDELTGKSDWELPTRLNAELYYRDDQRVMEQDASKLNFEEPFVPPGGGHRWVLTSKVPMHDDQNTVIGILGAYADISEQKAMQARLEDTLRELNAIVNNAQVGIAFLKDRRFVWINPRMERIFGYSLAEVKSKSTALYYADTATFERLGTEAYAVLSAGKVYETESQMRRRNGEMFWVQMRGSAVDATDMSKGSIWTLLDIDAQKKALGQLQELNASLTKRVEEETARSLQKERMMIDQARHAAMGEMVGNIAHQWRQPLSVLGLVIQNLHYDFKDGRLGEVRLDDYVAKALSAIEQMTGTIDDFRDFFKPDRRPEIFRPIIAIQACLGLVGASLRASNISLDISGPEDIELLGYPGEFSQIMLNLISNAKDALQERKIAPGRIDFTVTRDQACVVIAVQDNAGGIVPGDMEKIFDPYFTTKEKGTGIGLYMTRTIVEQHMHGTIRAQNAGAGARFVIALPKNLAAELSSSSGAS